MIRLFIILFAVIAFPLFCIALGFTSLTLALVFLVFSILLILLFLFNAKQIFIRGHEAKPLPVDHPFRITMDGLVRKKGVEKTEYYYWLIPASEPGILVWAPRSGRVDLFFSRGALVSVNEAQLVAFLDSVRNASHLANENYLEALRFYLDHLKGPSQRFRYWFISFFLYPLEHALKIAKI